MKKVLSVVVLLLGVCFLFGCDKKNYTANNTEFIIGCSGPLTGGAAIYGTAVNNSAKMAVDEINAADGLNGKTFKWVMTDDAHDVTKVANNYSTMFESGMQVSLGCVTSSPCLEFENYAEEDGLFFITPSATNDDVTKNYENAYQMCFSDSSQGTYAARYIKEEVSDAKIGVFYKSDDTYSAGIYENFKNVFTTAEQSAMVVTSFTTDTATDFSTQINKLKECDFIFMPIYYQPAALFMVQAVDVIADDAVYFGCDGFDGIDAYDGFEINDVPQEVSYLSHFNASSTTGAAGEFVTKYTETYGKETLNQFGAAAYDCVYAIYNAMKYAEENGTTIDVTVSVKDLCEILVDVFQNGSFSINGATGTGIKWNADGTVNKSAVKYIVKAATTD